MWYVSLKSNKNCIFKNYYQKKKMIWKQNLFHNKYLRISKNIFTLTHIIFNSISSLKKKAYLIDKRIKIFNKISQYLYIILANFHRFVFKVIWRSFQEYHSDIFLSPVTRFNRKDTRVFQIKNINVFGLFLFSATNIFYVKQKQRRLNSFEIHEFSILKRNHWIINLTIIKEEANSTKSY